MVDILKDHMPFPLWIPFFSDRRVGFVDVNGTTKGQNWPAAAQKLPIIREPLTSRTEEEPTGKRKRKEPEYRDASDSDDLDEGKKDDDDDAVVVDEESDDSSEDDEEEEPLKKNKKAIGKGKNQGKRNDSSEDDEEKEPQQILNKEASKEGPRRRGKGKNPQEKRMADLRDASKRHEKGRKSTVYLQTLVNITNQLNHPAKFGIVTGHDFGELLKRAGAFGDGEIVVRIKSILSEQDDGNYFGLRREK
jgi:hypothetical protein